MPGLTWYAADLKTGVVLDELPLQANDLSKTVSKATTTQATLDIHDPSCPANWATLLDGMRVMLVPVLDGVPLGGWILDTADVGDPSIPFGLSSLEACADYVFCRDHEFTEGEDDEAEALATLFADDLAPGWGFDLDVTPTGQTGDHSYLWVEDLEVSEAAAQLSSARGGPEWTTRVVWADGTQRRFTKTIQVAPTVGSVIASTIFEDHHTQSRRRVRSWKQRATHVIATGDGAGESRPMSPPAVDQAAIDAGVPPWQARVSAPTVDEADLPRVAAEGLARRRYGTQTWEVTLAATEPGAPVLGAEWNAGDTVTLDFKPIPNDPAEYSGPARVIGWRGAFAGRVLSTVTPVFWVPDDEEA